MRRLLVTAVSLLSLAASAETIETPAFRLNLEGTWETKKSDDPEQRSLYWRSQNVGLTVSYTLMKATPTDTERIAFKLKEFRLQAEDRAAADFNLKMTIAEPVVVPFSKGHQVAYFGHDSSGRQFRYLGLVFPNKTINVYAESKSRSQPELEAIFNRLLKGLAP